jgi:hypothetical protein
VQAKLRLFIVAIGILLIAAQFVPVDRTNPPVRSALMAPPAVMIVLKESCFDCHSHHTTWPWYSRVAPFSWMLARHVEQGRKDLNFSDWPLFDFQTQAIIMKEIEDAVTENKMPLQSYVWGHPEAKLDADERAVILEWVQSGSTGFR